MIPKNVRPGATAERLYGETVEFTIKANGKAFRSLIDTLYTNKILAVLRELCSNAHDSHVEAGQTKPFLVQIPTALDPIFTIRDYGVGMDHETVMHVYTTIFESTREDSNEFTGQLGLGSKSPFAYTDSFSVICYTGTDKRIYLTYLATDGVPCMTHVGTEPSDEPRGVEVSFAAKRESIPQFQKEMRFVSMAYDTPPTVEGMDLGLPEPQMSGTNWAIYPLEGFSDSLSTYHFIRMGTALYPSNRNFPHVTGDFVTITEIPIGTAMVTSSRDALSYDYETSAAVRAIHERAYEELYAQMEADVAMATTRRQTAEAWLKYTGILDNLWGKPIVSLRNSEWDQDTDDDAADSSHLWGSQPGEALEQAIHFGKPQNARRTGNRYLGAIQVRELPNMTLIVNDLFNKTVRRKVRINTAASQYHGRTTLVFTALNKEHMVRGIEWIQQCLELEEHQIVMVGDLTDYPPARKVRADGTSGPGPRSGPRRLGPNQYWMKSNKGLVESEIYGNAWAKSTWPHRLQAAMSQANFYVNWSDVFFVNDRQFDQMRKRKGNLLPKARRLDVAIERSVASQARRAPLAQALEFNVIRDFMGSYSGNRFDIVVTTFFPHIKITETQASHAITLSQSAGVDLHIPGLRDRVIAQLQELQVRYPLLFNDTTTERYQQYIKLINQEEAANS